MILQVLFWFLLLLLWYVAWKSVSDFKFWREVADLKFDLAVKKSAFESMRDKYQKLHNRLIELNKRDNPRITTDMMRKEIIALHKKWITNTEIWWILGFDRSAISKALKRWGIN